MDKFYKKTILYLFVLALLIVLGSAVAFADNIPHEEYYGKCEVYVNDVKTKDIAYTCKGNIYISINTLQKYGQTDFMRFVTADNQIFFNAKDVQISLGNEETSRFIKENAGEMYLPIKYFEGSAGAGKVNHVSLGSVSKLCKLAYRYESGKVYLYPYSLMSSRTAVPAVNMSGTTIGSELTLSGGNKVILTGETTSFYKVKDFSGNEYYVNKADFTSASGASFVTEPRAKDTFATPINLAWLMTTGSKYNPRTDLAPKASEGLDIMSPIWMRLEKDGGGSVSNYCEYGYVQLCHDQGMKVWACINNNFDVSGGAAYGNTVLNDTAMRNKSIAQYLLYAAIYDVDGINIDYESMDKSVIRGSFNTFVEEMYKHCSNMGITLSIATMLASDYWSSFYDFARLGQNADYICPMTYNEHWSKTSGAGSTMSRDYYISNTNALIAMVGKEKVLMGVPFFTQYWEMRSASNDPSSVASMGSITMKLALQRVKEKNGTVTWDEASGQYIAEYPVGNGNTYRLWLEENRSMAQKLKYVMDSGIAGTACWAYGQNTEEVLEVFAQVYKHGVDPLSITGAW